MSEDQTSATKCASFTATVYNLVPAGRSSAASITDILVHFPRGNTVRGRVRAALMRLAKKGLIVKTRQVSKRGGVIRYYFIVKARR